MLLPGDDGGEDYDDDDDDGGVDDDDDDEDDEDDEDDGYELSTWIVRGGSRPSPSRELTLHVLPMKFW